MSAGIRLNYSKTQIDADIRTALTALSDRRTLAARRDAMFTGVTITETEFRAELAIFEYINGFYSPRRRHSSLGNLTPQEFAMKSRLETKAA